MGKLRGFWRLLPRLLAVATAGALLSVIAPPRNLHALHWVVFVPVLLALRPGEWRTSMKLGFVMGFAAQATIFGWIVGTVVRFAGMPLPVGLALLALFAGVFALPYAVAFSLAAWLRERLGAAWVFAFPAWFVAIERLSPQLFPYYQGVSQYRVLWTFQLASVLGVMGVSYLILLVNCAVTEAIFRLRERRPLPRAVLASVAAFFIANLVFGAVRSARVERLLASARTLRVALLQTTAMHRSPWMALTRRVLPEHPDLVVWPESAISQDPIEPATRTALGTLAREGHFDLFLGGGTVEGRGTEARAEYNSAYYFDKSGALAGRYDKMVLLPFGEYMPLSDTFPWLKTAISGPGDLVAGKRAVVLRADGFTFAGPICYEAILDGPMRQLSNADLIVNVTNDGWFGNTAAPHLHAMLAAVQAVQIGRPLLRVAYTGTTFVVEPHGRTLYETKPFTEVAEVRPLRLASVDTLYSKGGWAFPWLCVAAAAGAIAIARRKAPRSESADG